MKIYSVTDAAFRPYGKILEGYDTAPLCAAMRSIPMPEQGTAYEPSIPVLEECALYGALQNNAYGGMPIQLGLCWGYNTRLNCLECGTCRIACGDTIIKKWVNPGPTMGVEYRFG